MGAPWRSRGNRTARLRVTLAPVVTRIDTKILRRFVPQDQLIPWEDSKEAELISNPDDCLLYTSPSPRD